MYCYGFSQGWKSLHNTNVFMVKNYTALQNVQ